MEAMNTLRDLLVYITTDLKKMALMAAEYFI